MNDPDGSLRQPRLVLDGLERPVVHRLEGRLVVRGRDLRGRHRHHRGGMLEDSHRGRLGQDWSLVHQRFANSMFHFLKLAFIIRTLIILK